MRCMRRGLWRRQTACAGSYRAVSNWEKTLPSLPHDAGGRYRATVSWLRQDSVAWRRRPKSAEQLSAKYFGAGMDFGKPILVTGASGKTGQRMVASIAKKGGTVRAFVRRPEAGGPLKQAGAAEIALGDLMDRDSLRLAMTGVAQVLHICPPMHPREDAIAHTMIGLAGDLAVDRFVLYSVLHPLLADVPHHDRKLQAERALVDSGLNYTILQPSRYMQHLAVIWKTVLATGVHSMPFATTARFSLVDLADLAEAAARVMIEPGHEAATYQLAGQDALSQDDCAGILTTV